MGKIILWKGDMDSMSAQERRQQRYFSKRGVI